MNKHKTLDDFTKEVVAIYKKYDTTGTRSWSYHTAAHDLSYQLGSLTKALMQRDGERDREGKTDEELRAIISDELADIFAETLFIAHELNISLEEAWERMIHSDEEKINDRQHS